MTAHSRFIPTSRSSALNLVGATVAGVASAMIEFYPFVVLEGVWALAALVGLLRLLLSERAHTLLE